VAAASRIYARALYDAARAQGKVAPVRQELEDFVVMTREVDELRELLRNPQLDPRAKAAALEAVSGGGDPLVRNFLLLLAEKGRAGELEDVQEEFERLVARAEGQLTVELTTAYELSETDARAIVEQIEQASGRRVEATRRVDPGLIGGIVLQAGSLRLDASVRGRLERLRHELAQTRS
jgi:F-type H+-transporting ATPase subunit delta